MQNTKLTLKLSYTQSEIDLLMSLPFYSAIEYWVNINNKVSFKDSTKRDRLFKLRVTERIIEECPNRISSKNLNQIERKDLQAMFKILENNTKFNQKQSTRVKWYKFICMLYTNLIQCRVITVTPTYGWEVKVKHPVKTEIIEKETLSEFLNIFPQTYLEYRDKAIFSLLTDTGIRIGSAENLELDNVKISQIGGERVVTNIRIENAKYEANYDVAVGRKTSDALIAYIDRRPKSKDTQLFLKKNGRKLKYCGYRQIFLRRSKEIGCSNRITPHMFRATLATYLADKIKDIEYLKFILGVHSDDVAYRYIKLAKGQKAKIENQKISLVDGLFSELDQSNSETVVSTKDENLDGDAIVIPSVDMQKASIDESANCEKSTMINHSNENLQKTDCVSSIKTSKNNNQVVDLLNETYKELVKQLFLQMDKSTEEIQLEASQLFQRYNVLCQVA